MSRDNQPEQTLPEDPAPERRGVTGSFRHLDWRDALRSAAIVGSVVLVLTILAPFNTQEEFSFLGRLLYWSVSILGGWLIFGTIGGLARPLLARADEHPLSYAALAVVASLPIAAWVMAIHGYLGAEVSLPHYLALLPYVFVITAVITAVAYLSERARLAKEATRALSAFERSAKNAPAKTAASGTTGTPSSAERFRARLDGKAAMGEILAVSSEDHYLRVYTTAGEALILMRLSDAVDELGEIEGARIHRSHWVARSAIRGVDKSGGKWRLIVGTPESESDQPLTLPVSRTYREALKQTGWV